LRKLGFLLNALKARVARWRRFPPLAIFLETFNQWRQDSTRVAASLAFFSILSLGPLLLILVTMVGVVTNRNTVEGDVYRQLADVVGGNSASLIRDMVQSVNESHSGRLAALAAVATLIYSAIGVFQQLQEALNTVWEVEIKPHQGFLRSLKRLLWAAIMLPVMGIVILFTLMVNTALSAIGKFLGDQIPHLSYLHLLQGLSFVMFTLIIAILFAVIYRYLPDVDIDWEDVLTGATVTALLFVTGQFLLSLYLTRSSVTSTYGAAGTFVVVLLWVYYSAQIFLFGAEFTRVFARWRGKQIQPSSYAYHVDKSGYSEKSQGAT
jgi:membrane protein